MKDELKEGGIEFRVSNFQFRLSWKRAQTQTNPNELRCLISTAWLKNGRNKPKGLIANAINHLKCNLTSFPRNLAGLESVPLQELNEIAVGHSPLVLFLGFVPGFVFRETSHLKELLGSF